MTGTTKRDIPVVVAGSLHLDADASRIAEGSGVEVGSTRPAASPVAARPGHAATNLESGSNECDGLLA